MSEIDRVKDYACEVEKHQWEELVLVADRVGLKVMVPNRTDTGFVASFRVIAVVSENQLTTYLLSDKGGRTLVSYLDFLAKLKGVEKWEPKNGEKVECRDGLGADWFLAKFIGYDDGKWAVCRPEHRLLGNYTTHKDANIRPLRSTITRKEAEEKLKALGVDVRITD